MIIKLVGYFFVTLLKRISEKEENQIKPQPEKISFFFNRIPLN